jgi:hypothetical protein
MRTAIGFIAYHVHAVLHWASFKVLPWAGDYAYRHERRAAEKRSES